MRRINTSILIALAAVGIAGWTASANPVPETLDVHEVDPFEGECDWIPMEQGAERLGGFYTNFWPNGIVPYQFQTVSTDSFYSTTLTDIIFATPAGGPEMRSATGFPPRWRRFDVIRVNGSSSNDARDFKIVGGTRATDTSPWTVVQVSPMGTALFNENATGTAVTVWATDRVSPDNQTVFATALTAWEDVANLDIKVRSGEADFIHVRNDDRSSVSGDVGHGSGLRTLSIDTWSARTVRHELGHSLGAKHEHQRPDRNSWVSVDTSQSTPRGDLNLNVDPTMTIYPDQTYDYGSIMHYREDSFLQPGASGPVISILDPDDALIWQSLMGTLDTLSTWDKKTMSFMYPESNWRFLRFVTQNPVQNGQFLSPWTVFDTAINGTPAGGRLIIMNPYNYVEPGVYSKAMIIEAPQGGVTIRAN